MPSSMNGIGTCYYGKREFRTDGSWLTTEWFIFIWIPIIPIQTVRITWAFEKDDMGLTPRSMPLGRIEQVGNKEIHHYKLLSKENLSIRQVISVYLYLIGWVILLPILSVLIPFLPKNIFMAITVSSIIIGWFLLPWIIRYVAKRKLMKR